MKKHFLLLAILILISGISVNSFALTREDDTPDSTGGIRVEAEKEKENVITPIPIQKPVEPIKSETSKNVEDDKEPENSLPELIPSPDNTIDTVIEEEELFDNNTIPDNTDIDNTEKEDDVKHIINASGYIYRDDNQPMAGAIVELKTESGTYKTVTDKDGKYEFKKIKVKKHEIGEIVVIEDDEVAFASTISFDKFSELDESTKDDVTGVYTIVRTTEYTLGAIIIPNQQVPENYIHRPIIWLIISLIVLIAIILFSFYLLIKRIKR